jgi:hypothetical protein
MGDEGSGTPSVFLPVSQVHLPDRTVAPIEIAIRNPVLMAATPTPP